MESTFKSLNISDNPSTMRSRVLCNPQKVLSPDDVPAKAFKMVSFHYIHCYCE